jgi:hypothetical protein
MNINTGKNILNLRQNPLNAIYLDLLKNNRSTTDSSKSTNLGINIGKEQIESAPKSFELILPSNDPKPFLAL